MLFSGPPGLGKTTLAQIVSRELGVGFRSTSGPVLARAGDLAALLTNLEPRDVLFIDEIHRLNPAVEEILYPAMEDYELDLIIGEGPIGALGEDHARAVHADRRHHAHGPPHHAVARPLRHSHPALVLRDEELMQIVARGARVLGFASPMTARARSRSARAARRASPDAC